nr:MAG TPA: Soluble lytic transglycosylase B Transglycosylase, LYASE [Caudoviricetes sp.]
MRITKLQEGNIVAVQDNTRVVKPDIPELIKAKPRQYYITDLGGKPSADNRTAAERNRDYWHPFKGAKERFKASMRNGTNPLVGLERTVMPAMAGAALVTTPATVIGGVLGGEAVNKATGGWGNWLESKTGLPSELGEYTNPGAIYGGIKGYKAGKLSKDFIFGNADLGWSPLVNRRYFKRYSKIPIEEGHYYRVTSDNEIAAINRSGKLQTPDRSYYDPQTAKMIAERLKLSLDEVLELDSKNPQLLDQMFNEAPKPKGTLGLRPRRKSNHGDVAFQKEGLFYDSNNPKSSYYGSPTIKGSQAKSKFQEGHHGKYTDNFNENININEAPHYGAAVLREGNESSNFTYFDRGLLGWREKTFDNNNGMFNRDHWIFNKEARTPTNIAMATANRVMPLLSNVEKTPARIAAYKVGRRTKGNASVSLKDIKNNDSTYTGSATPEGNNGDRDLLGLYLFQNDPLISRSPWFQRIAKSFKPAKGQGFNYDKRYSELYPGIEGRRYQMQSVVKSGHPLRFNNVDEFNNYSNGIGKLQGKEGDMVIEMPDGFQTFRQPGTNYAGPIDDVGGHVIKIDYNKKGKLTQISQDMWKFNPRDYAKRWSGDNVAEGVRATKQAALMDKVGTPFILQQENPIYIGSRRVWDSIKSIPKNPYIRRQPLMQGTLLTMKKGGLIPRCQAGATIKDAAIGMIPIVGTYQDYKKFRDNPTWGNFGWLAASALGDALFFTGAGAALKGIKAARAAAKSRALLTANRYGRSQVGFQRGLEYGASKGDVKSMFQNLRNYKVAEQKQLAAEAAARQQVISGAKNIGKDLGQDAVVNTTQEVVSKRKGGSLISDGRRFKFKDSPLVRNSRTLNNKRDMRKKFMKSDRPTYSTNRVRKGQDGLQFVSYTPVETPNIPKFESSDVFSTYNIPIVRDESVVSQPKVDEPRIDEPIIESAVNTPMKRELFNIKPSKGLDEFNKWYDEVEEEDPEAKHYRQFLTKMAEQESGFNSAIQNRAGAPAYGYFQFMQDGKKYNNITAYAGTDIETFRNNPKLQIKAAIKLAKSFERGFNKKDLELAAQKGYTKFGLLGGAWLAGNGGVRKYLQGLANPSDRHWSKSGSGTDVASRIQMFNF